MSSPTSTSSRPPAISTVTGLSAPRSTAATAAPVAPVPEAIVSPTPRSKMRERQLVERLVDLDRALRIPHLHELEAELAASGGHRAGAVLAAAREVGLGAEPRAAHVHRAQVAVDAGPDLPRGGAHGKGVG